MAHHFSARNSQHTLPGRLLANVSRYPNCSAQRAAWYKPIPRPFSETTAARNNFAGFRSLTECGPPTGSDRRAAPRDAVRLCARHR